MKIKIPTAAVVTAVIIIMAALAACSANKGTDADLTGKEPVMLSVSTMYAGKDTNADKYRKYVRQWEDETGNEINDISMTADDSYKTRVIMEFQSGAEPDVLFFFNGVDADELVENRRVVSIDEIREEYPEYAANMKEGMMAESEKDGRVYCVPVNGYWEGLFVNTAICADAGVPVPGPDTTWEEFTDICEAIKDAGYIPIAASLAEIPHYWFEFCIYNHQTPENHLTVPESVSDAAGTAWIQGLSDIKDMYERGFFPENTLSTSDEECLKAFVGGRAAFLLDGSWRLGAVEAEIGNSQDYCITFVPGTSSRKATDIIGGLSSGYYITRKAWNNPEKREAAVRFVEFMTSDEVVSDFAQITATALTNGVTVDTTEFSPLMISALDMTEAAATVSEAVQDKVPTSCRTPVFDNMAALVTGTSDIGEAVQKVIDLMHKEK